MSFTAFLNGLLVGAALIIAIGAQNMFVLRQGLARRHVFTVALTSSLSDGFLISLGALGVGGLIAQSAWLTSAAAWGGAAFLLFFAAKSALAAARATSTLPLAAGAENGPGRKAVILAALAFGILNPHALLDTVVMLGGLGAQYDAATRPAFVAGAISASFLWFFALAYGARLLAPLLTRPAAQRALDALVAAVMAGIAASLVAGRF